ncbi:MAG: hypothetical protein SV253_00515 [Halobacteria archaeon]|nr:hypothetical protein [Halobacteria archaeon]
MASVSISIPDEIHDEVLEYAEKHTESVDQAYVELVEFALNNVEHDPDEDTYIM